MNTRNYFEGIYDDFFGVEKEKSNEEIKKGSQEEMTSLFEKINNLYVTDDSKNLLKKIIEYMRKYDEGIEKNYIPFNIILEINNSAIKNEIVEILSTSALYFSYIDKDKKEISMYELDNDFNCGFIILNYLNGINLEEDKNIKTFFHNLEEHLKLNSKSIMLVSGTNEELTNFFLGRESIKNKYFEFKLVGINPDVQDIYEYVNNKLELDDNLRIELLDYISNTYNKGSNYIEYQNDLVRYISFNKEIPKKEEPKSLEEIFKELNELVGLSKVKKVLYELVDMIKLKEKAGSTLKINDINLHMIFLGNPGTGKTTIARIISSILYNLGYVKENKLIEVSSKDLVAEYVGQTAPKTMSVIEKSLNGVLFIDEAYTLAVKGDNTYNSEAIATLIQCMENYRDKLVVIFAGYTKEMQDFLNSNSGIASRIGYTLEFDDYTTDELKQIFLGFMNKAGFIVKDDALEYLEEIINKYRNMKNFGNARFIRNIYEKTIVKHASNVKDKKRKDILKTITKEDINIENLILE
ncbi:MAG: AAA family ATPase [Bacilli bacterium]|nr:AAA family ATPase [Bacilli bacterium]